MQLKSTAILACALAFSARALPTSEDLWNDELMSYNLLPESGQITYTPLEINSDGFDVSEEGMNEAILDDWKTSVVQQHNAYRSHYGAGPLSWSDALYSGTLQWAQQCKFQHSDGRGAYGENLAAGTGNAYGFTNGLKDWMDEGSKYNYNKPGTPPGTGHFTQVVWKGSKQVACAIANCRGGTIFQQPSKYVVCRYNPPGNFVGRYPENVGRRQ